MKRIKQVPRVVEKVVEKVTEMSNEIVDGEGGLAILMGKRVNFHCINYNYQGILSGVNTTEVELTDAKVVFETGPYDAKTPKLAESLPKTFFLRLSMVEGYWEANDQE